LSILKNHFRYSKQKIYFPFLESLQYMSDDIEKKNVLAFEIRLVHYIILNYVSIKKQAKVKDVLMEIQAQGIRHITLHKLYALIDRLEQLKLIESRLTNTTPPSKELTILRDGQKLINHFRPIIAAYQESVPIKEKGSSVRLDSASKMDEGFRYRIYNEIKGRFDNVFIGKEFESVSPTQTKLFESFVEEVAKIIYRELSIARAKK